MRPWISRAVTGALLALLASACGTGGQNRPSVVGSWPAAGESSLGPLPYVRIDYNEPVRILNPFDYRLSVDGIGFGTFSAQDPDYPNSVFIYPSGRNAFPADSTVSVFIIQGLAVNTLDHYASGTASVSVGSGSDQSLPVGEAAAVSLVDCITGATDETVAVPGTHAPVAVLSTTFGTTRRIWTQLDSAGGTASSLAYFEPGDGAMTPIPLTSTGELTSPAGAMAIGPLGKVLYAAFRDEGTDTISLHVIDTQTATEVSVLTLESQEAQATAVPRGLALAQGPRATTIHITTEDDMGGMVARVDHNTFTELDQDGSVSGIQGIPLPNGGGPTVVTDNRTWIAHDIGSDMTLAPQSGAASDLPGSVTGTTTSLVRAPTDLMMIQGLTGFTGTEMLQGRDLSNNFSTGYPIEVSDDVGGASTGATAVIGITWLTSSDNVVIVLDTPGGAVLTEWFYAGSSDLTQVDLDPGTDGIQGITLASDPIVLGTNHGPYQP